MSIKIIILQNIITNRSANSPPLPAHYSIAATYCTHTMNNEQTAIPMGLLLSS